LVGEAQAEMQAYVDCNTNKTATMVEDINGMITKLTADYNTQLSAMTAEADSLTGAQNEAVLRNIDALTAGYQSKMAQLQAWQQQLLDSMVTDADRTTAAVQDIMVAGNAAIQAANAAAAASAQATADRAAAIVATKKALAATEAAPTAARLAAEAQVTIGTLAVSSGGGPLPTYTGYTPGAPAPAAALQQKLLMQAIGESAKPTVSIQITAPLVQVQGSADRATADLAASLVQEGLKNVVVEATSSGAPSTSKRILISNRMVAI
jgi:sulfite reductase alpha subunit-like flavoprotein